MNTLFLLLWLGCTVAMVYFLIQTLRKRGRKRNVGFAFLGGFVALILFGATVSPSTEQAARARTAAPEVAPARTPTATAQEAPSERLLTIQKDLVEGCATDIAAAYPKYAPTAAVVKTVIPAKIVGQQVRAQVQAGGVKFNCSASEGSQDFDAPQIADATLARRVAAEEAAAQERVAAQARAAQAQADAAAAKQEQCGRVQLVVESWTWSTEGGDYLKATGQVTNVTDSNIENAEASVSYYTADETFVKNGEALIDYNPILPGQRSPFSTIDTGNPAIEKASIEFKELMGGTLSVMERKEYDRMCG